MDEAERLHAALEEVDNDLSAVIRSARGARLKVQQALGWADVLEPSPAGIEDD